MAQKPLHSQKTPTGKLAPLKARKVVPAMTRVPFLDADEFVRRRQTGQLSRYVE